MGDNRAALAMFRKANEFISPDYPGRFVIEASLKELEAKARWEEKLPAVLRGELKPANSDGGRRARRLLRDVREEVRACDAVRSPRP